jgi:hypothetical protein
MAIILYASHERLSAEQVQIDAAGRAVYVRAVHVPNVSPLEAFDHLEERAGETFLNSIPDCNP